jgi:hypothetical protein
MCWLSATTSIQNSDWHYDRMQAEQCAQRPAAAACKQASAQRSAKRAAAKGRAQ